MRNVLLIAIALLVAALATAPAAPLFDPDEGYYPATAAESVDRGAGWDLRLNGESRWDKPFLPYGLIEASFAVFGRSAATARIPSAVQGALLVLIAGACVLRLAGAGAALWTAAVLATTVGIQIFARVAHPEIGVVLGIATTELLFVVWLTTDPQHRRWWIAAGLGAATGYGVLAKGPVAVALPVLMAIAILPVIWTRIRTGWRDAIIASVCAAAVALPWYVAMTVRHGSTFLYEAVWRQNVGRYSGDAFRHDAPVWFYVLPTIIALLPWSVFLAGAIRRVEWRDRSTVGTLKLAMAAAAGTAFLFYSASASKLPHYVLVLMPPLAVLIGLHLDDVSTGRRPGRRAIVATAVTLLVIGVALAVAPLVVGRLIPVQAVIGGAAIDDPAMTRLLSLAVWPTAAATIAGAVALWWVRGTRSLVAIAITGALLVPVLLLGARPLLSLAYPWNRIGLHTASEPGPLWLVGPRAPSLTFYAGRSVTRIAPDEVFRRPVCEAGAWIVADAEWLAGPQPRMICPELEFRIVEREAPLALARMIPVAAGDR